MDTPHTPGPWRVDRTDSEHIEINAEDYSTCTISHDVEDTPEMDANARLIAAAPDLLALVERVAKIEHWQEIRSIRNDARALLNKLKVP